MQERIKEKAEQSRLKQKKSGKPLTGAALKVMRLKVKSKSVGDKNLDKKLIYSLRVVIDGQEEKWLYFDKRFTVGYIVELLKLPISKVIWDDTMVEFELGMKLEELKEKYGFEEADLVSIVTVDEK